jgi:hypothetical protein
MNSAAIVSDNIVPTRIKYYTLCIILWSRVRQREVPVRRSPAGCTCIVRGPRAPSLSRWLRVRVRAFPSRPTSPSDRHSQPPVSIFKVSLAAGSSTHSKAERAIILYACAATAAEWLAEKGWLCTAIRMCVPMIYEYNIYYDIILYYVSCFCVCVRMDTMREI